MDETVRSSEWSKRLLYSMVETDFYLVAGKRGKRGVYIFLSSFLRFARNFFNYAS